MGVGYLASKRNLAFLALLLLAITFSAPSFAVAESGVTIWRLSNPYTGEHLFTTKKSEYDQRASEGWKAEGTGWEAPTSGDPVYRLYNPYTGEHHYTMSWDEYSRLPGSGWRQEDVAFFSAPDTAKPVYRLYNPYAKVGTHHYTTSIVEYANLGSAGWRQEREGWYGLGTNSLPAGWVRYTGTLVKTTLGARAREIERGNPGQFRGLNNILESTNPHIQFTFDAPTEITAMYHDSQGDRYVKTTVSEVCLYPRDMSAFDAYSGQHLTIAVNEKTNNIVRGIYNSFGPELFDVAVISNAGGSGSGTQPSQPGGEGVWYHLYNPYTGEHHYTQSQQESKSLQDLGWTYMGTVDQPPQSSGSGSDQNLSVKVYKVHHPGTNGYVYTTDEGILPGFLDGGRWMLEGVYDSWDEVVFTPGAKYGVRTPDHKTYIYLDDENEWKTNLQLGCEDVGPGKGWA